MTDGTADCQSGFQSHVTTSTRVQDWVEIIHYIKHNQIEHEMQKTKKSEKR